MNFTIDCKEDNILYFQCRICGYRVLLGSHPIRIKHLGEPLETVKDEEGDWEYLIKGPVCHCFAINHGILGLSTKCSCFVKACLTNNFIILCQCFKMGG